MPWTLLMVVSVILAGVAGIVWVGTRSVRHSLNHMVSEYQALCAQRDHEEIERERELRVKEQQVLLKEILALAEEVRFVIRALESFDEDDLLKRPLARLDLVEAELANRVTSS